jgi:thiol-disulfide isomerase/thioredoxin
LAFCLAALTCCQQGNAASQSDWQPAPFEIHAASGELFHYPGDLNGPTIILFWATWCPYCKALMPHLQSIVDEYGGRVSVVALNFKDDGDPAGFLAERGFDFKLILNSGQVANNWRVKGTPGLFLVDRSGRVVFSQAAIPRDIYLQHLSGDLAGLKHFQKAARLAPFWAAHLRKSLDRLSD